MVLQASDCGGLLLVEDHVSVSQPATADELALYLAQIHDENWNTNEARLEWLF